MDCDKDLSKKYIDSEIVHLLWLIRLSAVYLPLEILQAAWTIFIRKTKMSSRQKYSVITIESLPTEVLLHILSFLGIPDLVRLMMVSLQLLLNAYVLYDHPWELLCLLMQPHGYPTCIGVCASAQMRATPSLLARFHFFHSLFSGISSSKKAHSGS